MFDCVAKVEKHYRSRDRAGTAAVSPYYRKGWERNVRDFPRNPGSVVTRSELCYLLCYVHELIAKRVIVTIGYSS